MGTAIMMDHLDGQVLAATLFFLYASSFLLPFNSHCLRLSRIFFS